MSINTHASHRYRPGDIINDMPKYYGSILDMKKALRAKDVALNLLMESPKDSYTLLRKYGHALKSMNASTIFLKWNWRKISISSTRSWLQVVVLEGSLIVSANDSGAYLNEKYKGVIFIASSMDGNTQIYPLTFGIVDKESDQSQTWFLDMLKRCIGEVGGLLFVSDQHVSITKSVREVFPVAAHSICMHHFSMNLNDKFKNDDMHAIFILAVKGFRKSEFRYYFSQFAGFLDVRTYLQEIGFEKWTHIRIAKHLVLSLFLRFQ